MPKPKRTRQRVAQPDYTHMTPEELLEEGRAMYARLQQIWHAELRLPTPNWQNLAIVSEQMRMLEEGAPEVTQ